MKTTNHIRSKNIASEIILFSAYITSTPNGNVKVFPIRKLGPSKSGKHYLFRCIDVKTNKELPKLKRAQDLIRH